MNKILQPIRLSKALLLLLILASACYLSACHQPGFGQAAYPADRASRRIHRQFPGVHRQLQQENPAFYRFPEFWACGILPKGCFLRTIAAK
jgi:hypothetical protein